MRVYHPMGDRTTSLFVAPAKDPRGIAAGVAADWVDGQGEPVSFVVDFKAGVATVPDSVGRYLVATKQAKSTRLWLPGFMAA